MIKVLITSCIITVSLPVFAATGTIHFQGKIVENACDTFSKLTDHRCAEFVKTTGINQIEQITTFQTLADVQQAIKTKSSQIANIEVNAIENMPQVGNIVVSYR
ncbi:MAG: hypothetical protein QM666_10170 [Acinetobacter sp.]